MEQLSIYSKNNLSDLICLFKRQIPTSCFIFNNNELIFFKTDKKYYELFINIISKWINEKQLMMEVEKYICPFNLEANEYIDVVCAIVNKIEGKKKALEDKICRKLKDIFIYSKRINLDGFINFCMKDYKNEINFLSGLYWEDYIIEERSAEFVELLKYYVTTEEERSDKLYILQNKNGTYNIYNENKIDITDLCFTLFKKEFQEDAVCQNDFLISILIILLPRKIFIYGCDTKIGKTLKKIFRDRITIYKSVEKFN